MKNRLKIFLALIGITLLAIFFETLQQRYYMLTYKLPNNTNFFVVLSKQALSWFIWFLSACLLIKYIVDNGSKYSATRLKFGRYLLCISFLVALNVFLIAFIRLVIINNEPFNVDVYINQYVRFFIFQKTPVYTLAYIAVILVMEYYFQNEALQYEILNLTDVKAENDALYQQLEKEKTSTKDTFLSIKIGNSRKIVAIDDVMWVKADDYCAVVHTKDGKSYTMRSTLKSLDEKLGVNFLRVHRSAIVNMRMAQTFEVHKTAELILIDGTRIPVSKSYLKHVKSFFAFG